MAGESRTTTDHDTIRQWIEQRGGRPASVRGTERGGEAGVLRVDFPGRGEDDAFEELDWGTFFDKFEQENLAFLYQDQTKEGQTSRFFKFVQRETH
jgi:hypothetical protein